MTTAATMKEVTSSPAQPIAPTQVEPFLLEVADVVNTTLDLETTLRRVAELVRKVINYEIFAILLLNEQKQELYVRFQVGYPIEVADRPRIKVGQGVTGGAAQLRQPVLVTHGSKETFYGNPVPNSPSPLPIPPLLHNPTPNL